MNEEEIFCKLCNDSGSQAVINQDGEFDLERCLCKIDPNYQTWLKAQKID
jgi:hypothetical protein